MATTTALLVRTSAARRLRAPLCVLVALAGAAGCSERATDPRLAPLPERPGSVGEPIIGGTPDTTHQAVVAVLSQNSACTGTIIQKTANYGYVLTAAHCVGPDLAVVAQGNDYNGGGLVYYSIDDWQAHSGYNQQVNDFAMLRVVGVGGATPVIPAMTPAQDALQIGTPILHVGYGMTSYPNSNNSARYKVPGSVSSLTQLLVYYDDPNSGPCFGDSGGPQLTTGTERVAGVTSAGPQGSDCTGLGWSGRVSAVYNSFIAPYINGEPQGQQTCAQCFESTTSGVSTCADEVAACFNNADCDALNTCLGGCSNATCQQNCVNAHPTGYTIFNAIYDCVCTQGCVAECGTDPMCTGGGTTTTSTTTTTTTTSGTNVGGSGAGGAGSGASSGTGASSDGWVAGDAPDEHYTGEVLVSSGCTTAAGSASRSRLAVLLAGLGAAFAMRRRRRSA